PELYEQEPHDETLGIVPQRDRAELALLEAALRCDMPVLAVCRGSQVLNVARGGDLVQYLPDVVGDDKHRHTPRAFADHDVTLEPGTRLAELLGDHTPVKSHHHQGSAASARDCASRRTLDRFARRPDDLLQAKHAGRLEDVERAEHVRAEGRLLR